MYNFSLQLFHVFFFQQKLKFGNSILLHIIYICLRIRTGTNMKKQIFLKFLYDIHLSILNMSFLFFQAQILFILCSKTGDLDWQKLEKRSETWRWERLDVVAELSGFLPPNPRFNLRKTWKTTCISLLLKKGSFRQHLADERYHFYRI